MTSFFTPHCSTVSSSSAPSACIPLLSNPPFPLVMLYSLHTLAFKPLIPLQPILFLLPLLPHHRLLLLAALLRLLLLLTLSGFFNGMLAVFESGALNCFIFSRPIPLILSASRNLILTHLPLSGFLDSLLCVLIAHTPGLASLS